VDYRVIAAVSAGKRPSKPPADLCSLNGLDDSTWVLTQCCWKALPSERPTATYAVNYLKDGITNPDKISQCDWKSSFLALLRSNLADHPFGPPAYILGFPESLWLYL
jgi:hypothetical protein